MRILQTLSSSTLQIFIKISISHRIFLAEKIYLINKKEKKREEKKRKISAKMCSTIPNLSQLRP